MRNEELIAQAISVLYGILKSETVVKVNVEVDSEWDDGMESLDISVKYYPKEK